MSVFIPSLVLRRRLIVIDIEKFGEVAILLVLPRPRLVGSVFKDFVGRSAPMFSMIFSIDSFFFLPREEMSVGLTLSFN